VAVKTTLQRFVNGPLLGYNLGDATWRTDLAALIESTQPALPPRRPRLRRSRCVFQACVAFFVLPASLLVALFLAFVLYQIVFLDRIFIGVHAMGVDLGGMTRAQATAALSAPVDAYLRFPVTLRYQDRTWTITARQAGAALDVPRMVNAAYAIGHHSDLPGNVVQQLQALQDGVEVETAVHYDSGPANTVLTQIAQLVDRPARDAQLIIQPDIQVVAVSAQSGWAVDIDATRAALYQRALDRDATPVSLVVRETPPSVTEVEGARRLAEELLNGPLTLSFASAEGTIDWTLSPAQLADMFLTNEEVTAEGTGRVTLAFDKAKWLAFLNPLAQQVERAPVDARLEIDPTTRVLRVLRPSQSGQTLDIDGAWQAVANLLVSRPTTSSCRPG
jgi:hypothetical protein